MNQLSKFLGPLIVILGVLVLSLYHFSIIPQDNAVLLAGGALLVLGIVVFVWLNKKYQE